MKRYITAATEPSYSINTESRQGCEESDERLKSNKIVDQSREGLSNIMLIDIV